MNYIKLVVDASVLLASAARTSEYFRVRFWLDDADRVLSTDQAIMEFADAVHRIMDEDSVPASIGLDRFRKILGLVDEYVPSAALVWDAIAEAANLGVGPRSVMELLLARKLQAVYFTLHPQRRKLAVKLGVDTAW